MPAPEFEAIATQFRQTLTDCRRLYESAARQFIEHQPASEGTSSQRFIDLMDDLHKGLLIKIYSTIAQADRRWSAEEAKLAEILFEHLWGEHLSGERLREAALHIFERGSQLRWYTLVRPFEHIPVLQERIDELETIIVRLANLVAKCDGTVTDAESSHLHNIQSEVHSHLRPLTLEETDDDELVDPSAAGEVQEIEQQAPHRGDKKPIRRPVKRSEPADHRPPAERLNEALADLHQLIGLESVKREVATLANYLKMQRERTTAGLPTTELSLHMVFTGNPGTGKTSVARIIGRIFGAMGILARGHLIETDRSGLIAAYAGQTSPKTNKTIDEALDGILFIDEAYSLVSESGEDAYGHEAVQALLKRMEDDRDRLVVVLAGYPEPMDSLLRSNPGLTSRFSMNLAFDDYRPSDLGRIFQSLCDKNRYQVPGATQAKLLLGFQYLYDQRDEHFGNGRMVRNTFEHAIRRLANRIAGVAPLTPELLTVIQPSDIEIKDVPPKVLARASDDKQRFLVPCPGCGGKSRVPAAYLGQEVKCKACGHRFVAAWGEPLNG